MKKKLPAIYRSDVPKRKVNKEAYYSFLEEDDSFVEEEKKFESEASVLETIEKIFTRRGYPFNVPVQITLPGRVIDTFLAARTKTTLLTMDDEVISIASILKLQIKKQ